MSTQTEYILSGLLLDLNSAEGMGLYLIGVFLGMAHILGTTNPALETAAACAVR
jgi:hypothetical protein